MSGTVTVVDAARESELAVAAAERNDHARVVGILHALLCAPPLERRPRVALSAADEEALRDVDARQMAAFAVRVARRGAPEQWREVLADHFWLAYRIELVLDAVVTERL